MARAHPRQVFARGGERFRGFASSRTRQPHFTTRARTHERTPLTKKTHSYDMLARYRYAGLAAVVLALACADWCKYVPQAVWSEVSQCADC